MLNKKPGDAGTITAVFSDDAGNVHPLAGTPTISEPTGALTFSPSTTQSPTDTSFSWNYSVPPDAVIGSQYNITVTAEGDPTPGQDTITGTFNVGVVDAEDTKVTITGT